MGIGVETPIRRRLRRCGAFVTGLALLAGLLATLRCGRETAAPAEPVKTFDCEVGGRMAYVLAGHQTAHHENHPWQVLILDQTNVTGGGILLRDKWVLTTASSWPWTSEESMRVVHGPWSGHIEPSTALHAVSAIYRHPEYEGGSLRNDIALLELADPVAHARYSHANLPGNGEGRAFERVGSCAVATGWHMRSDGHSSLASANVRLLSLMECREVYGQRQISAGEICAGVPRTAGDTIRTSFGWALTVDGSPNGPKWLVGIGSYDRSIAGTYFSQGNFDARPGVYTRVSDYLEWIESTMAEPRKSEPGPSPTR